ncbi:MAG: hypothetical protein RLZ98_1473 [Pseudomonadota bacterium]|jgi:cell division protein FtsI (penicillin-binding protein 3)
MTVRPRSPATGGRQSTSASDRIELRLRARARARGRTIWLLMGLSMAFMVLAGQLVRLGLRHDASEGGPRVAMNSPVSKTFARPDIVDRAGRLLATDLVGHSLYADPSLVLDADRAAESLIKVFPDLDAKELRQKLGDPARRFEWIKRGLTPRLAQRAHDLGIPGLALNKEPKRTYPLGRLAGHLLGVVSTDNHGLSGIERHVDQAVGIEMAVTGEAGSRQRVRLTVDVGVQHALEEELAAAVARYSAQGAAGVVLDAETGEIAAIASLPDVDPAHVMESQDPMRLDRMTTGRYELGSVFKVATLALALEAGMRLEQAVDVQGPLEVSGHKIRDLHPAGKELPLGMAFLKSSNVGFGRVGLMLGEQRLTGFFARLGLSGQMQTEAGPVATMRLPKRWGEAEIATAAFGHGIAVTPLQFAVAAAALVNGGRRVAPTVIARENERRPEGEQVVSQQTSARIRAILRDNVAGATGTGKRADVPGYEVGGKTGTAEQPVAGKYVEKSVISSFLAAFPMSKPRYVTYVLLFQPQPVAESEGKITAGHNAAPLTAKVVRRIAPLLGVAPRGVD